MPMEIKIQKADKIIEELSPIRLYPILLKFMNIFYPNLLEKILENALSNHLVEVIRENLFHSRHMLMI